MARQHACRAGDATQPQLRAQAIDRAAQSHLGRVFAHSESATNVPHRLALEVSQEDGLTVGVTELIEGFVQVGSNFVPELGAFGWFHSGGVLFARAAACCSRVRRRVSERQASMAT